MKGLHEIAMADVGRHWGGVHEAAEFEMADGGRNCGSSAWQHRRLVRAANDPRRLDHSGRRVKILDDAAAGGISQSWQDLQYRMDPVSGHLADDAGAGGGRAGLRDAGAAVA